VQLARLAVAMSMIFAGTACRPASTAGEGEGEREGEGEGEGAPQPSEGEGNPADCAPRPPTRACIEASDPCAGQTATHWASFVTDGNTQSNAVFIVGDENSTVDADTTRAAVEALLGPGVDVSFPEKETLYCEAGLAIVYVVVASGVSVVDVVSTVGNAGASTQDCGVELGRVQTGGASGGGFGAKRGGGESLAFYPNAGLAVLADANDIVLKLVMFEATIGEQSQDFLKYIWTPSLDLGGSIGKVTLDRSTFVDDETAPTFGGESRDVTLASGANFKVVSAGIHGLSLAGACDSSRCDDSTIITSVAMVDPSAAVDANGIGLGSSQSDIEAVFGRGSPDAHGVVVYSGSSLRHPLGVVYRRDDCIPRATALILGYDEATSFDVFFQ
jgi:hypothetical protein